MLDVRQGMGFLHGRVMFTKEGRRTPENSRGPTRRRRYERSGQRIVKKKTSKFNKDSKIFRFLLMIFVIISHINFNLNEAKISICGPNGPNVQEVVELA